MFSYVLRQLEEVESLLIELGASGSDLNAKIESVQHTLSPETADALIKISHAIKLSPEFFSESDIDDLETLVGQIASALNKLVFEKGCDELREHFKQTMHLFEPSMFERIKNFFTTDPEDLNRRMEPSKVKLTNLLRRYALSCDRCNSLSVPILDTADRYKCIKCERQFISAKHYIRQAILENFKDNWAAQQSILKYYAECVERITDQE